MAQLSNMTFTILHRITQRACLAIVAVALFVTLPALTAMAQGLGDLMVAPTRVVFEGRARSASLTLINRGTESATYRISFTNMRMNELGVLERIESPGPDDRPAAKMIRYAPRQVTLKPGEAQAVRLSLRRPADLPEGEYRSHLTFRGVPPPDTGEDVEAETAPGEIAITLIPIYGVSIPVIIRHGELSATATLSDLELKPPAADQPATLWFRLSRKGDRSLYGDMSVLFEPADGGEALKVAQVRGVALYVPNDARKSALALRPPEGATLGKGRLRLTYSARPEEGGEVLAEAVLDRP